MEKQVSIELQDQDGNTALHVACQHGQLECATEMTKDVSPSKLAPVLETQNWRGEGKTVMAATKSVYASCYALKSKVVFVFVLHFNVAEIFT